MLFGDFDMILEFRGKDKVGNIVIGVISID